MSVIDQLNSITGTWCVQCGQRVPAGDWHIHGAPPPDAIEKKLDRIISLLERLVPQP